MNVSEIFRLNMIKYMEDFNITQSDLSRKMGKSRSLVGQIIRRRNGTSLEVASNIATALELPLILMLDEETALEMADKYGGMKHEHA